MTGSDWPALVALPGPRVLDISTPVLRADEGAAARGDGCFETVLAVAGDVRDLPEHLLRLRRSAAALDLEPPADEQWHVLLDALLGRTPGTAEVVLRLQLGRGAPGATATWFATASPVPPESIRQRADGVRVLLLDRGHDGAVTSGAAPWLLLGAKSLSYAVNMAALRHAAAHDADDVLFLIDGTVAEGPRSSVLMATPDGTLVSPPATNILDGITVARVLRAAAAAGRTVQRRPIEIGELATAVGLWLTSSVRLLAEVRSIDGRPVPTGPLTAELAGLLQVP